MKIVFIIIIIVIVIVNDSVFRINIKEEQIRSLKESTSGCVAIKSGISMPLVTQGFCDLLARERRKNSQHKFTIIVNSQL